MEDTTTSRREEKTGASMSQPHDSEGGFTKEDLDINRQTNGHASFADSTVASRQSYVEATLDPEMKSRAVPTPPSYYPFMSPHIAAQRTEYLILLARVLFITIILMWGFLPLYWASLAYSPSHVQNLVAWVIDHDQSTIGQGIVSAIQASQQTGAPTLGWINIPPTDERVKDVASVIESVVEEKTWVALVVNANATSSLLAARSSGNASYDPTTAVTIYYAQARNELASGNFIFPITSQLLAKATAQIGTQLTGQFLSGSGLSATALESLSKAPQTVANPVGYEIVNLRPYDAPVATALTLVGEIYLCIFAFIMTMANFNARQKIGRALTLRSYMVMRIIIPLILYLPLSLSFATISLPFEAPFDAKYTFARGWWLYFAVCYLTMSALGLATEAMITLLTPKFIAFFLLALIISNVSVASLPNDLQPGIYKYGRGWPVFNASQAIRTIIFNTKSHLDVNIPVILAWVLLSVFTVILFTFVTVRKERRSQLYQSTA